MWITNYLHMHYMRIKNYPHIHHLWIKPTLFSGLIWHFYQFMIPASLSVTVNPGGADATPAGDHHQVAYFGVHNSTIGEILRIAEIYMMLRSYLSDISHYSYNPSSIDGTDDRTEARETIGRALHTRGVGVC